MKSSLIIVLFMLLALSVNGLYHINDIQHWSFQNSSQVSLNVSGGSTHNANFYITEKELKQLKLENDQSLEMKSESTQNGSNWSIYFWFQYNGGHVQGTQQEIIFEDVTNGFKFYYDNNEQAYFVNSPVFNANYYVNNNQLNLFSYGINGDNLYMSLNEQGITNTGIGSTDGFQGFHWKINSNYSITTDLYITDLYITNNFDTGPSKAQQEYQWFQNLPNMADDYYYKFNLNVSESGNLFILYQQGLQTVADYVETGGVTGIQQNQLNFENHSYFRTSRVSYSDYTGQTISFWVKMTSYDQNIESILIFYQTYQNAAQLILYTNGILCYQPISAYQIDRDTYCATGYGYILDAIWTNFVIVQHSTYTELYVNGSKVVFDQIKGQPGETTETLPETYSSEVLDYYINFSYQFLGYVDDFFIKKSVMNSAQIYEYFEQYKQFTMQCALIFTECNYTGEFEEICGHTNSISLPFMKSILLPHEKKITLFTGTEFTGDYQVFTESVVCQELVYIPQQESQ